jgi:DNA-binding LacI/PurR family transcriptional regulator
MIVTSWYHDDFIKEVKKIGIPIVLVDYYLPTEDISSILSDKMDGVVKGAEYLHSLGHRRIAYLKGDITVRGSGDRLLGFRRAVEMFDLDPDERLILDCDFTIRSAYVTMKRFLEETPIPPTAVMAVNDIVAMGAMEAIKERSLKIPEDMSVLGFDDIDLASEVIPHLSTMHVRKHNGAASGASIARPNRGQGRGLQQNHVGTDGGGEGVHGPAKASSRASRFIHRYRVFREDLTARILKKRRRNESDHGYVRFP